MYKANNHKKGSIPSYIPSRGIQVLGYPKQSRGIKYKGLRNTTLTNYIKKIIRKYNLKFNKPVIFQVKL